MKARLDANYGPGDKVIVDFPNGVSLHGEVIDDIETACYVRLGARSVFVWKEFLSADTTAVALRTY